MNGNGTSQEIRPLVFATPSRNCGARVYNGAHVWVCNRRYRKRVRRLGGRYANVLMVYSPEHNAHWWAIEDELFYDPETE